MSEPTAAAQPAASPEQEAAAEPSGPAALWGRAKVVLDRVQQRFAVVSFPVAVYKKSSDDKATQLAALVSYYAFFAIFPLLLVLVTVLGIVLKNNDELRQQIIDSALGQFPVLGTQLKTNVDEPLQGSGLALVVGLVGTFLGARGMANAFRTSCDTVWAVPRKLRRVGLKGFLIGLAILVAVGGGLVATSVASGWAVSTLDIGTTGRFAGILLAGILNIGVFAASFRLATSPAIPFRSMWLSSVLAAACWTALQIVGGLYVTRQVSRASDLYGVFALVIGSMAFLYLSAYLTVLCLEVDAVRVRHLWPRAFFDPDHLTAADRRAFRSYAESERRSATQQIDVTFDP